MFRRIVQALFKGSVLTADECTSGNHDYIGGITKASGTNAVDDNGTKLEQSITGGWNMARFTFTAQTLTVGNTTAISFGKLKLGTFPLGRIGICGGTLKLGTSAAPGINWGADVVNSATGAAQTATIPGSGGSGDISLGTTGTADSTLNSTDVDIMASTALIDPFTARLGYMNAIGTLVTGPTEFDGTATAKDIYLNMIIDDADVADADSCLVAITGTLTMLWQFMGP